MNPGETPPLSRSTGRVRRRGAPLRLALLVAVVAAPAQIPSHAFTVNENAALRADFDAAARKPMPGRVVAHESALLQAVYAGRAERPLWSDHGRLTKQGSQLADILLSVDRYGLKASDYAAERIAAERGRLEAADARSAAQWIPLDLMLSHAAIRLVTHLHFGRIDPRAAGFELSKPRSDLDVVATVVALASAADVAAGLSAVEPHFYHYRLLETALGRYRQLAADRNLPRLPPLPRRTLRLGDPYAGAAALRRLLSALGDLPAASAQASSQSEILDAALIDALKQFQARNALTADGALGKRTFAVLTTPLSQRVRQIELTLERWRWLPAFDAPPIIVNIPQFRLFAFPTVEDRVAGMLQMPVIVGQTYPRTRTPVFVGQMKYVIFRPYWDVPYSITLREMLPEIRKRADYLEKNQLEIVRGESDEGAVIPPSPAAFAALAAGQLRLRQRPGEDNALGLIKFIFPNAHNVYMHSTPAHRLFLQSRRAFSHGCIRVSDPVALARYVLRNGPGVWDDARIVAAMNGPDSTRITLPSPIPVMILYGTAEATEAGPILFFEDIYGHDRKLAALLRE